LNYGVTTTNSIVSTACDIIEKILWHTGLVSSSASPRPRSLTALRRRSPILFFSTLALIVALIVVWWELVVDRGCGCAPAPYAAFQASVDASALRCFEANFHVGAAAAQYNTKCKETSYSHGTLYIACPIIRDGQTARLITTVYGSRRRIDSSRNFVDSFSFLPN